MEQALFVLWLHESNDWGFRFCFEHVSETETMTSYQSNLDKDPHKWLYITSRQFKCDFWRSFLAFKLAIFENWKCERGIVSYNLFT